MGQRQVYDLIIIFKVFSLGTDYANTEVYSLTQTTIHGNTEEGIKKTQSPTDHFKLCSKYLFYFSNLGQYY